MWTIIISGSFRIYISNSHGRVSESTRIRQSAAHGRPPSRGRRVFPAAGINQRGPRPVAGGELIANGCETAPLFSC
jgi:hypothetical protein